ncbi:DUF1405 domain-containing protein [Peribacillus cavernae]|uniref:DUF1405 domain-containing protein n=1 Tax=Peribacillus cavernae TaxID=1674310 RepID=A0A3S0UDV6_9BACI|nr:DUF1405 domain-containing protein [Peribacillus cavernae]MDQ0218974.1 putative membrane protein YpjA [Peribacillus cavernae]RUQ29319.1 DUF1405 domain-containing protein [Peribacillus cavernae]
MNILYVFFANRNVIALLFVINILGTIYGYYWYGYQLQETPAIFLPFVPDSPTASLFFAFVLLAFLLKTNWGLIEALAIVTLFKYGIWAVVMNLLTLYTTGYLPWEGYMLIASHFAMAIQGILYSPFYRMKAWHLIAAAIWTIHNDIIDYVFNMMPRYSDLMLYMDRIGYFTFWLSILSIFIGYYFGFRKHRYTLSLEK